MAGIIDENNDEPTVQARHTYNNVVNPITNSIGSTTVHAHKVPAQVSPFELGMYTLLAALCFAIVAFVISCVVYASKYKQNSLEMPTTTLMSKNRLFGRIIIQMHGCEFTGKSAWEWRIYMKFKNLLVILKYYRLRGEFISVFKS